jgi:hypothetical protein
LNGGRRGGGAAGRAWEEEATGTMALGGGGRATRGRPRATALTQARRGGGVRMENDRRPAGKGSCARGGDHRGWGRERRTREEVASGVGVGVARARARIRERGGGPDREKKRGGGGWNAKTLGRRFRPARVLGLGGLGPLGGSRLGLCWPGWLGRLSLCFFFKTISFYYFLFCLKPFQIVFT